MLKQYTFWFSAATIFQVVAGLSFLLFLFMTFAPANETEREILTLLTTHKINAGSGFSPTYFNIITAFSSGFALLCIFAAVINGYLLFRHTEPSVMKGIIGINLAVFGVLFATMAYFTFLLPIFSTGLIFVNLLAAYVVVPKIESAID